MQITLVVATVCFRRNESKYGSQKHIRCANYSLDKLLHNVNADGITCQVEKKIKTAKFVSVRLDFNYLVYGTPFSMDIFGFNRQL
jgi:hypothetical protein